MTSSFIKKETLTQVFSCEFWHISRTPFLRTPPGDFFRSDIYGYLSPILWNQTIPIMISIQKILEKLEILSMGQSQSWKQVNY